MKGTDLIFYVKLLVSVIMLGTGLFFILYPDRFPLLEPPYIMIIGAIFIARGVFRAYSAYKHDFEKRAE